MYKVIVQGEDSGNNDCLGWSKTWDYTTRHESYKVALQEYNKEIETAKYFNVMIFKCEDYNKPENDKLVKSWDL